MDHFPKVITDLVRDCLQFEPSSRPSANDIAERLVRWHFRHVDLNRDAYGNTLVHMYFSAETVDDSIVDALEALPSEAYMVNAVNHFGETPLMIAKSDVDREALLLEHRQLPPGNEEPSRIMEYFHDIDVFGTMLKLAEKEDVGTIKLIGENRAFVRTRPVVRDACAQREAHTDRTPLHVAAKIGNVALFDALMDLGVLDTWRTNSDGRTPLHVASQYGHVEIMQKLLNFEESSEKKEDTVSDRINLQDKMRKTALHLAAAKGNMAAIKLLLSCSDTEVNLGDMHKRSPIFEVVWASNLDASTQMEVFRAFVNHPNIDFSTADTRGETILHHVARTDSVELVRVLFERADQKILERESEHGYRPLHLAVHEQSFGVVNTLVAREDVDIGWADKRGNTLVHVLAGLHVSLTGVSGKDIHSNHTPLESFAKALVSRDDIDLNVCNARGDTPLHVAIQSHNNIVAKVLLSESKRNLAIYTPNKNKKTALHLAAKNNMATVVKMILSRSDVNVTIRDHFGRTAKNAAEAVALLLSRDDVDVTARDKEKKTALHFASMENAAEVARMLLSRNDVDVNARDNGGKTALHWASEKNAPEVAAMILSRDDVDVNARDNDGWTALHCASSKNAAEVAAMILSRDDVDVNARDNDGWTALHCASSKNAAEVARMLLSRDDVDVNAQNKFGKMALHFASEGNAAEVATMLLSRDDVDVTARDKYGKTALHYVSMGNAAEVAAMILSRDDVDVNARDKYGWTALYFASSKNAAEVARMLLSRDDVDVTARDKYGKTALHLASRRNAAEVAAMILSRDDVDVDARDKRGWTVLHFASMGNAAEVARMLLSRDDVDVNARDRYQQTPLHLAVPGSWNLARVAALLLSRDDVDVTARDEKGKTALDVAEEKNSFRCAKLIRAAMETPKPMPGVSEA